MEYTMDNGVTVSGLDGRTKGILKFLTKGSNDDCLIFLRVLDKSRSEKIAVNKFRLHKIKKADVTIEEIKKLHNQNEVKALERLFMHPITDEEKKLLTERHNDDNITLNRLFDCHKREPRAMLLRFLL